MTQDCSHPSSTADVNPCQSKSFPKGINIIEADENSAPRVEVVSKSKEEAPWGYLFIRHYLVENFEKKLKTLRAEGKHVPNSFIHRTTDYKRKPNGKGVMKTEKPTISGLVFLQGETEQLTSFLEDYFPSYHLVNNCSTKVPYSTDDKVDNPVSLYAATKKSNELMAHAYSKLYNIQSTGLRFFTVYGPAGRPDMAYFGFTNKLVKGETIKIFNYGNCKRDFTYVDDIVEGVVRVMQHAPEKKQGEDGLPVPPYKVYNIGNNSPENLLDFVTILQEELVRAGVLPKDYDFDSHKELVPMQPGDVPVTYADTTPLEQDFGFKPSTNLREGLRRFAEWYAKYYNN